MHVGNSAQFHVREWKEVVDRCASCFSGRYQR
ncbi:hypothetical protein STAFG_7166 [Streptomyces afghaniensis 772]|uniref:Uncharacterized protein n=1 Tax=Streptomyces afghaniensis 772 TaxID=1283301 RepID=S4MGZ0_9ACTN|nr:hypothetical protein STAFG_7166 [Streptomyces afghaniensis 772]